MNVNLALALGGGLATFFLWTSLFLPAARRRKGLAAKLDALDGSPEAQRLRFLAGQPMLDRALGPALAKGAAWLGTVLKRRERDAQLLLEADYPSPFYSVEDFYAVKLLTAVLLLAISSIVLLLIGLGAAAFILALFLAALGFFLPDISLRSQVRERREMIVTEMAFALDRLAIHVAAGQTIPAAILQMTRRPGGPFIQELRQVALEYSASADLEEALENMAARAPMQDVRTFVSRLLLVHDQGGELVPPLRLMAAAARERLNLLIEERGHRNALLMVVPIGALVMPAIMLVVLAPGVQMALGG